MKKSKRSARHLLRMMLVAAVLMTGIASLGYSLSSAAQRAGFSGTATRFQSQAVAKTHQPLQRFLLSASQKPHDDVKPDNHTSEPRGKIAFASDRDGNFQIYVMAPDGGEQTRLTNSTSDDLEPAWSPDGTKLAFVSNRDGNREIYVMNSDGSNQIRLTNNSASDLHPVWSPDGSKIAFYTDRDGSDQIYVMNPDGSGQTRLTNNPGIDDIEPAWSPSGQQLAFASNRDDIFQIYKMNADGSGQTRLTTVQANDTHPAWSSGRITFQSDRDNNDQIYVVNPDGTGQVRLTSNTALDYQPARSSDGAQIVFASTRDGNFEIYAANADGSNQKRLTNNAVATDFQPAVQPLSTGQAQSTVQFSASTYTVNEGAGSINITVTRTGDTSGLAVVDYAATGGTASERSDFETAIGTLRFAAGETSKTFAVLISDDAFVESDETINLTLSNPTGATLGTPNSATLTIVDNDSVPTSVNPIDSTPFFVRQQYLDFLNREPDTAGFNAWVNVLNNCSNVNNNPSCDRILVSQSFFLSPEFQSKGFFAIRFYLAALGRVPTYREFVRDLSNLNGQTAAEATANQGAFPDRFVQSDEFKSIYDPLTNTQFVDRLVLTAGVTITNRDQLISDLNTGAQTRAQVLRGIVLSTQFTQSTFNRAFVLSEYFGYLRRDPDAAGFQAWLNFLNMNPGDFRTMVRGFVNSIEYRSRFGQP